MLIAVCIFMSAAADQTPELVSVSDIEWEQLNPARGDKSPKAGTLWGDRNGSGPTGFLVKFLGGFSSPPHIHNVAYRGLVISGHIHNDDPNAESMWMPAGSFWTQPAGEIHITAAKGSNNLAYIEIDKGPYLVLPTDKAFDSGERPINVDESNIVWINQSGTSDNANGLEKAYLWGVPQGDQLHGTLIKLPTGLTTRISSHGNTLQTVVIKGQLQYQVSETETKNLAPGSYFSSAGKLKHQVRSYKKEECILYVRSDGKLDITH